MYRRKMRGMYISKRALRKHFDPCECPNETYLLCQLQWRGSIKFWQHWLRNDDYNDCHAEQFFLEEIFEPRSYNICDMTWYLSWSPCGECSGVIRDFLEEQPNVNIDIRVARLYYVKYLSNRMGLRQLNNLQGVTIKAMEAKDYDDCWETFIQPGVNYDFSPKKFKSEIQRNRSRLEDILQGLAFSFSQLDSTRIETETNIRLIKAHQSPRKQYTNPEIPMAAVGARDPSSRENNHGWKIQPGDFQRNYSPRQNGRMVCLLYEIRWRNCSIWRNWCTNNTEQHAEVNFLENHFSDRPQISCSITWFLSTSPCGKCSRRILEFLRSHPNVTLEIYAAKLFRRHDTRNRQGLRNLIMNGVSVHIMNLEDYRYCWRNFVAYQAGEDDYWSQNINVHFILNSIEVLHIFLGLPPFLAY
ncbi:DNA dC-_dU-editing enzyme APOBEC-3F-like [Passer domesticus]|uniref:DNA dC->dU-editing enzyme APOBEC-3F-like n=1 Tax=Passer domesticus TaxID=48849 RepID=UPI0030FE0405